MQNSSTLGLSILAGGLAFVGNANAVDIVVDGSYQSATNNYVSAIVANGGNDAAGTDGGWTHFSTYNYSAGYTQPGPVGSGTVYLRPYNDMGGSSTVSQVNSLTRAITVADIDGGAGQYTFSAWFSTYIGQNDYSVLTLQFLDESMTSVGSPIEIGGAAFVAALPGGTGVRAWGEDLEAGGVPVGARYALITSVATALVNQPDGYIDLVRLNITNVATITVTSATPPDEADTVSPAGTIRVVLQDGTPAPVLNTNSIQLFFDGSPVSAVIQKSGGVTSVEYDPPGLLPPGSAHNYMIAFNQGGGATANRTNGYAFTVSAYYNLLLPAPIHLETFETTAEGSLPGGWTSVTLSGAGDATCDPLAADIGGLQDLHSACYTNWVVVNSARFNSNMLTYPSHTPTLDYQRVLSANQANVVNGAILENLAQGNIVFGNSGYQDPGELSSQIVYLFSPDFDLTGRTNVYLSFHSLWEQNQDSIAAVEYSVDQGATWLPIVYMIDDDDILRDGNGNIDALATLNTVRIGGFEGQATYIDPISTETRGGYYGAFIGAASNTWATLGPYLNARVDDDPVESKRVEIYHLPAAANQSRVRLRFAHAGTDSWYFGLDNVGLYSVNVASPPLIEGPTPTDVVEAVGNSAALVVTPRGVGPFTYQWQRDGVNLNGQTNATLALTNLQLSAAGSYRAIVGNLSGSVTSSPTSLSVFTAEPARVIGQWDFDGRDLRATCGLDLEYSDQHTTLETGFADTDFLGLPRINGQSVNVMFFPGAQTEPMDGYIMRHGLGGTGVGTNVNQYTLIMDVLYPEASDNLRRALLQTNPLNTDDDDFRINEANGLGVSDSFQGRIETNTWYRIALAVDLVGPGPNPVVAKFINGVKVGQQTLTEGRDGRWSLSANPETPWARLFADNDVDTQLGFVSSIQLRAGRLSDAAIAAMGGPQATKIPGAACATATAGNVTIRWSGSVLEAADNITGPWAQVVGAARPYAVPTPLGARKFYRAR
ncbi:MAG TPA: hypothetical protein VFB63_17555 [Bryobacteraceae bacterium]|nr:hypothetical protein [Bryobacteraceae bacterium]